MFGLHILAFVQHEMEIRDLLHPLGINGRKSLHLQVRGLLSEEKGKLNPTRPESFNSLAL